MSQPKPLFHESAEALAEKIGMESVSHDSSAWRAYIDALEDAQTTFHTRLGRSTLNGLLSLPVVAIGTDPATLTENQWRWLVAERTERLVLRLKLLQRLKALWLAAQSTARDQWNDVPAFREVKPDEMETDIERLEGEVEANMQSLAGEELPGSTVHAVTVGPKRKRGIYDSLRQGCGAW